MSRKPIRGDSQHQSQAAEFERQACEPRTTLIGEFLCFLVHNKKWWLAPIVVVLLLMGLLVVLGGSPLAPLIYTVF